MDAKAEKLALFRYGVIASLVIETLPRGELTRRAQEIAARHYDIPDSKRTAVSVDTLLDWAGRYPQRWLRGSLLGLLLASMGIYGTVSYIVVLRTREVGIRMAIGAQKRDVLGLTMRESTRPVLAGLIAGKLEYHLSLNAKMRGALPGRGINLGGEPPSK
jgi:hypothetical protein